MTRSGSMSPIEVHRRRNEVSWNNMTDGVNSSKRGSSPGPVEKLDETLFFMACYA